LITTEETLQSPGRAFLESINGCWDERKYSDTVQGIFLQGNLTLDQYTDIPSVPVVVASNVVTVMFGQFVGDDAMKDIIDGVTAVQVEGRGREPTIPIVPVFDLTNRKRRLQRCADMTSALKTQS
jgi:hypothetical protein